MEKKETKIIDNNNEIMHSYFEILSAIDRMKNLVTEQIKSVMEANGSNVLSIEKPWCIIQSSFGTAYIAKTVTLDDSGKVLVQGSIIGNERGVYTEEISDVSASGIYKLSGYIADQCATEQKLRERVNAIIDNN